MTAAPSPTPKLGAIAVVLHESRLLLVQRGKDPGRGVWGFPGGHVELGETGLGAAERELREETGVVAKATRYLTNVDAIAHGPDGDLQYHFLIAAVLCAYQSGDPIAADDAAAAEWVSVEDIFAETRPMHKDVIRVARLAVETELV